MWLPTVFGLITSRSAISAWSSPSASSWRTSSSRRVSVDDAAGVARPAAEQAAEPGEQLVGRERLGEIVVRADRSPATRSNDSVRSPDTKMIGSRRRAAPGASADLVAGQPGQVHVEDDRRRPGRADSSQRRGTVLCLDDPISALLEDAPNVRAKWRVVVNDQHVI